VKDAVESLLQLTPPVDFIEEFALVVPSMLIARILGVPYEDHKFFQSRSHTFTSNHSTRLLRRFRLQPSRCGSI
jgi:cytochrome P450